MTLPETLEKGAFVTAPLASFNGAEVSPRTDIPRITGLLKADNRGTNGSLVLVIEGGDTKLCSPDGASLLSDDELEPAKLGALRAARKRYNYLFQ